MKNNRKQNTHKMQKKNCKGKGQNIFDAFVLLLVCVCLLLFAYFFVHVFAFV